MTSADCCHAATTAVRVPIDGRFELVDHDGRAADEHSYGERLLLVFFGFTHCTVVCPRELAKIADALKLLGDLADRVQPLYISVDPARDDPPAMRRYLARYDAPFIGLTGTQAQVGSARRAFRVFAERIDDPATSGGYRMPHTSHAYLLAPGGRYLAHFADTHTAATLAQRIRAHLIDDPR